MKRSIIISAIIAGTFLYSCHFNANRNKGDKEVITVSILPQKTFIEKIAGDDFKINVLLAPGASPADFTLLPSQLIDITRSEIWFRIGYIGFEYSWKEKISQANTEMKVVNLSEGLELIRDENLPFKKERTSVGVNPHIWMSPTLVKQMSARIVKELSRLNPEKKSDYQENYRQFAEEIDQLDASIANALKDYKGRRFIMFHPSLSYYAREYGLVQYSLEPGGKEPTPQRMAGLAKMAREEGIRVIYIQSDLDREQARVFAEEIDGEIIEMWPLNPDWKENLLEITSMLVDNFEKSN